MKVEIVTQDAKPKAVSVAVKILEQLDVETISLIKGTAGIFDVYLDGKLVFSKHKLGISKTDDVKEQNVISAIKAGCVAACGDEILEKCR